MAGWLATCHQRVLLNNTGLLQCVCGGLAAHSGTLPLSRWFTSSPVGRALASPLSGVLFLWVFSLGLCVCAGPPARLKIPVAAEPSLAWFQLQRGCACKGRPQSLTGAVVHLKSIIYPAIARLRAKYRSRADVTASSSLRRLPPTTAAAAAAPPCAAPGAAAAPAPGGAPCSGAAAPPAAAAAWPVVGGCTPGPGTAPLTWPAPALASSSAWLPLAWARSASCAHSGNDGVTHGLRGSQLTSAACVGALRRLRTRCGAQQE